MADTKISALTAASAAAGANEIPINEAGTTKKITLTQVQALSYGDNAPNIVPKFRAWRNSAYTSGANFNKVPFDSESYDVGSDFDAVTNNRFTAPVSGYYIFTARMSTTATTRLLLILYKNGAAVSRGSDGGLPTGWYGSTLSDILYLAATDYIELWTYTPTGIAFETGEGLLYLSGHLISV